jgi:hypothetical protein
MRLPLKGRKLVPKPAHLGVGALVVAMLAAGTYGVGLAFSADEEAGNETADLVVNRSKAVGTPTTAPERANQTTTTTEAMTGPPKLTYKYRVDFKGAVETQRTEFADKVAETFKNPRGWSLDGTLAFDQVTGEEDADFTIWLSVAEDMPSFGEICSETYSCRADDNVVINEDRWINGADVDLSLDDYRTMVINHETGHWLGFGHPDCPRAGEPALIMQQQSMGEEKLNGCLPNAWPTQAERDQLAANKGIAD